MSQPRRLNQPRPPIDPAEDDDQPQSAFDHLNLRQQRFVQQYLLLGENGTQAYLASYPTTNANSAHVSASRLLRDATVQAAIAEQKAVLRTRLAISPLKILRERARLAFSDMHDFTDATGL